jgi:hypothetical protein
MKNTNIWCVVTVLDVRRANVVRNKSVVANKRLREETVMAVTEMIRRTAVTMRAGTAQEK